MNNNESDFHLQPVVSPVHHDVVSSAAANANNPRKKLSRMQNPKHPSRNGAVSAPKREKRPEITIPCSECGKRFWSPKALFGHMRCHPERQWRGINPPPNLLRHPTGTPVAAAAATVSEDENDVAASLLLLASGRPKAETDIDNHDQYDGSHGGFQFECSSCKKVFGSRQALGGHRASHKNVKGCFAMSTATARTDGEEHKCGICLMNFPSGQALGGHVRCHFEKLGLVSDNPTFPGLTTTTTISQALNCSFGGLDLNLPAPVEDHDHVSSSPAASEMALDLGLGL